MEFANVLGRDIPVTSVDEPRVRFYLDNQRLIETWAAIRSEASEALWDRVLGLTDVLAEDAEMLGETDATVRFDAEAGHPRVEVARQRWVLEDGLAPLFFMIERQGSLINSNGTLNI